MERMIIFCMLFFCSSMAQTAAPYKIAKYKQLLKTINLLETTVKDKDVELLHTPENPTDGCLFTAVTCFQKGILKLQPENSQVNSTFTQTVKVLKRFTLINPRKVGFPHNAHNRDHCSLFSIADTTCNGGISESNLVRKTNLPFITLEIKNVQFSVLFGKAFTLILAVNYMYVLGNHAICWTKGQGLAETIPTSAPYQPPTVAFFGCGKARRQVVFDLGQFSDPDTCTAPPHELARRHELAQQHKQPEDVNKNQASG
ncbi:uncharacterized protein LOC121233533 [Aquila chrysaetos chrysaetos]|uniref:uncharacterized protein LOC121233533 n=1 Tax=Aquila chrysaetos chrysaetos TaxID=223781 RepID=UPI001B7D3C17|nr:uncharacterized protein LOC121233533 [Aquila chrysaetos chrysaetos]